MTFGLPPSAQFGLRTRPMPESLGSKPGNQQDDIVRAAIAYVRRGWYVFPLAAGQKTPATPHGFKDAVCDAENIPELFSRPGVNLGIATGPSGLVVLDIDGPDGEASLARLKQDGEIPRTYTTRARRGDHLYFQAPPGVLIACSQSEVAPGIDVRAVGGYIVAPPSFVKADKKGPAATYRVVFDLPVAPLPTWMMLRLMKERDPRTDITACSSKLAADLAGYDFPATPENIRTINTALARRTAPTGWGAEDKWFQTLQEMRSLRDHAGWPDTLAWGLFDKWSQWVGGNYDTKRNRRRWDHRDPPVDVPRTFASLLTQPRSEVVTSPRTTGMSAKELATMEFPPLVWVIRDLLPQGCYLVSARPKVGKSWMVLQWALSVALGDPVWGKQVDRGVAIYLALEDNPRRLQSRLEKLRPNKGWASDNLILHTAWPRFDAGGLEKLEKLLQERKPRLVVIDTLAKIRPSVARNQNAYLADYTALAPCTELAQRHGCAIVIVTHNRKGKSEDDPLEMINGTLGQAGAVDGAFVIDGKRGESSYQLTVAGRDIEKDGDFAISRRSDGGWDLLGGAAQVFVSTERREILNCIQRSPMPLKPKEISNQLQKNPGAVRKLLLGMVTDGQIMVDGNGRYATLTHTR